MSALVSLKTELLFRRLSIHWERGEKQNVIDMLTARRDGKVKDYFYELPLTLEEFNKEHISILVQPGDDEGEWQSIIGRLEYYKLETISQLRMKLYGIHLPELGEIRIQMIRNKITEIERQILEVKQAAELMAKPRSKSKPIVKPLVSGVA
jgi:hypothetical protein